MQAAIDEVQSQGVVVAEGPYQRVGTTCGLDGGRAETPRPRI